NGFIYKKSDHLLAGDHFKLINMELGLYTFADLPITDVSGRPMATNKRITELMEEIKLADEVGLDVFGVGEHHRVDYSVSSPAVILGAAAAITKQIKLSSAV